MADDTGDLIGRLRSLADCDARAGEPLGKCMREAADAVLALKAEVEELREERNTLRMLLARYGDRVRMANASAWQEVIDDALAGRCSKCGGLHGGSDCYPPVPSRPLPHTPIA